MTARKRPAPLSVRAQPSAVMRNLTGVQELPKAAQRALAAAGDGVVAVDKDELRAKVNVTSVPRRSLDVSPGAPSSVDLKARDHDGARARLRVEEIRLFDKNPREAVNERSAELKEGLRATGFIGSMPVTRRPGEEAYMLCMGGNTTLQMLKELWVETREPRFEWVDCTVHTYRGETWLLAGHLVENINRGSLTFWDNARGVMELKADIEAERGAALSLREFEAELPKHGLTISKTVIALYSFAISRLATMRPATAALTGQACDAIRTRVNHLRKLAVLYGLQEEQFWREIVDPALRAVGASYDGSIELDPRTVCDHAEERLAEHAAVGADVLRLQLGLLQKNPDATLASLVPPAPPAPAAQPPAWAGAGSAVATASPAAPGRATVAPVPMARSTAAAAQPPSQAKAPALTGETSPESAEPAIGGRASDGLDPETSSALPPVPPVIGACLVAAIRLARATDVADCLELSEAMPLGYHLEIPDLGDAPSLPEQAGTTRHPRAAAAWWVLATLGGQFHEDVARRMAPESRFHAAWRDERVYAEAESRVLGPTRIDAALEWLLDSTDPTGGLLLDLLRVTREAREAHRERFPWDQQS